MSTTEMIRPTAEVRCDTCGELTDPGENCWRCDAPVPPAAINPRVPAHLVTSPWVLCVWCGELAHVDTVCESCGLDVPDRDGLVLAGFYNPRPAPPETCGHCGAEWPAHGDHYCRVVGTYV